jgi:hypothetical protein
VNIERETFFFQDFFSVVFPFLFRRGGRVVPEFLTNIFCPSEKTEGATETPPVKSPKRFSVRGL